MFIFKNQLIHSIIFFALLLSSAHAADLRIDIKNIRGVEGKLQIAIFNKPKAFKHLDIKQAFASFTVSINAQTHAITLHDVPAGKYAITLFHDENSNNELEMSKTNLPKEGYGTSNAKDKYDDLDFSEASFVVGKMTKHVAINMFYMGE